MRVNEEAYHQLINDCKANGVQLIAVSKLQPVAAIKQLYDLGHRDFGENYVQELVEKQSLLPSDIRWHFIGHLQSNKVKFISHFVHLIHGVDSPKLLAEINKQGKKAGRLINCLLQVHIAREETKFGLNKSELDELLQQVVQEPDRFSNVHINGLMGMASFSDDLEKVRSEMQYLHGLYQQYRSINNNHIQFQTLSMGMSGDYKFAIEEGSTMIRIGSLLFGARPAK